MIARGCGVVFGLIVVVAGGLAARAQNAGELRYKLEPGTSHVYKVEIRADRGDEFEILSGHPEFKVQSVAGGQAKVYLGNSSLGQKTERKPGAARAFGPPGFPSMRFPRSPFEFQGHEVILNDRGQVASERGHSQVSYMLGNLASLVFEPFPEDGKNEWSYTQRETISITRRSRFSSPFRGDDEIERLNAEETAKYMMGETVGDLVKIRRDLALKSVEKAGDGPRLELALAGDYVFNRKTGLPEGASYDGQVVTRDANVTVKVPLTVRISRLTAEELAKLQAEKEKLAAELKVRQEQEAAERKKPLTVDERNNLLDGLTSGDNNKAKDALRKLKDKDPPQADKEIALQAAQQLASDDLFNRQFAAEALEKWATADEVPALVRALDDKHVFVVHAVLRALGRLKDPTALPAIMAKMSELSLRTQAAAALKVYGGAAEKDVLVLLSHDEWTVRMEACNILSEIGSGASLAPLKAAADTDKNPSVKFRAKSAREAIEKRTKT
jgi:hypothetical protein